MKTAKNIAALYKIFNELENQSEARRTVETMISSVIFDLQDEGKEITAKNLEQKIESYVKDFLEASIKKKSA